MLTLYSAQQCPYALRTRFVLCEKNLPYEHIEIDLKNKLSELARVSRYGKVPALVDGDRNIYESSVINEYLEDAYPAPALMPRDPGLRAYIRMWIDFANTRVMPASKTFRTAAEPAARAAARRELGQHFSLLTQELGERRWFAGDVFTLADISFAPLFARMDSHREVPGAEALNPWLQRIAARPAYVRTGGLADVTDGRKGS